MRLARPTRGVRYFGVLCTAVAVFSFPCCSQAVAGLPACEAKPPTIESVTLKEVTVAGVSLEAQINPQGNETSYKFTIVWRAAEPTERGESPPGGPLVQEGHIGANSSPVTVSASLSGLQPDYLYWYEVIASNLGGTTRSIANMFLYFHSSSAPNGAIAGPPYAGPEVERTACLNESGNLAAAETVREQREIEAKEAAAKQATAKEATAKQAAAKEAEEAPKRSAEETSGRSSPS